MSSISGWDCDRGEVAPEAGRFIDFRQSRRRRWKMKTSTPHNAMNTIRIVGERRRGSCIWPGGWLGGAREAGGVRMSMVEFYSYATRPSEGKILFVR